ncbi:hypothetical protein IJ090_03595 [Candidatus Saccharibacteria bacterium]|nr:hypothetical protein [Candidatus Saccharibacteria bacterium]
MRVGKTIGARREQVESESERMLHREKVKRRKLISVGIYLSVIAVIALGIASIVMGLKNKEGANSSESGKKEVQPTIEIVDEASVGVSRKAREFVGYLEQDLQEYGLTLTRAVLPRDKTREVDVYLSDFEGYFKLSLDRGAGVSAEDMERMVRYFAGRGITSVEYVDLRVEGKAYYKGEQRSISEEEPGIEASYEDIDETVIEYDDDNL